MDGGDWIALAWVVITGGFSLWAAISARRAKSAEATAGARAEGALKAERAAVAAQREIVGELKRASDLREADKRREDTDRAAIDADPWELQAIPGDPDVWLINRSATAKFGIRADGFKVHGVESFDVIGPGKREEVSINRIMSDDDDIVVTWHQLPDRSDNEMTTTERLPSRIKK